MHRASQYLPPWRKQRRQTWRPSSPRRGGACVAIDGPTIHAPRKFTTRNRFCTWTFMKATSGAGTTDANLLGKQISRALPVRPFQLMTETDNIASGDPSEASGHMPKQGAGNTWTGPKLRRDEFYLQVVRGKSGGRCSAPTQARHAHPRRGQFQALSNTVPPGIAVQIRRQIAGYQRAIRNANPQKHR